MVQSADGNTGGAIRDIASMVQMSNHMKTDPPLISVLVAISLDRHASRAIEHVLATSKPITKPFGPTNPSGHPDPWSQVEGPLADPFRCSDAISRSLQMEEAFGLSIFCDLAGGLNGSSDLLFVLSESQTDMLNCRPAAALWRVFFITEDVQAYRRKMDKVQALSLMPYHEGAQDRQELSDDDFKDAGVMTAMLVPALVNCLEAGARGDAIRGLAQLGIAMEKYKSVEGEYPANLDLLLPEYLQIIPRDPFDGKRLKMVEADGDVVLYSIGPDGVDDGGKEYNWDDKKGDITFCLGDAYATRRLKAVEEPEEIAEENVEEGESR